MVLTILIASVLIMMVCFMAGRRLGQEEVRAELEAVIVRLRGAPHDENFGDT